MYRIRSSRLRDKWIELRKSPIPSTLSGPQLCCPWPQRAQYPTASRLSTAHRSLLGEPVIPSPWRCCLTRRAERKEMGKGFTISQISHQSLPPVSTPQSHSNRAALGGRAFPWREQFCRKKEKEVGQVLSPSPACPLRSHEQTIFRACRHSAGLLTVFPGSNR